MMSIQTIPTTSMALKLNFSSEVYLTSRFPYSSSITISALPFGLKTRDNLQLFGVNSLRLCDRPALAPAISRRLFLPSVSGIWDALTGGNSAREASIAIRRGMQLFRQGDVHGSLVEFDKAIELDPRQQAYLWQRGLSLYYLDRFEDGAEQFRLDVAANPNDTEESIWCFLCEAQLYGVDEARETIPGDVGCEKALRCLTPGLFKAYNFVGQDPRPVMRKAYHMFKDGGDPEKLVSAFIGGQEHEYFYASLYAGLYHESQNNPDAAKFHMLAACQSPYGLRLDDYMASLAKVHCLCRNWSPS